MNYDVARPTGKVERDHRGRLLAEIVSVPARKEGTGHMTNDVYFWSNGEVVRLRYFRCGTWIDTYGRTYPEYTRAAWSKRDILLQLCDEDVIPVSEMYSRGIPTRVGPVLWHETQHYCYVVYREPREVEFRTWPSRS